MKLLHLTTRLGRDFDRPLFPARVLDRCQRVVSGTDREHGLSPLWRLVRDREFDVVYVAASQLPLRCLTVLATCRRDLLERTILYVDVPLGTLSLARRWKLATAMALCGRVVCCGEVERRGLPKWLARLAGERLMTVREGVDVAQSDVDWPPMQAIAERDAEPLHLVSTGPIDRRGNHRLIFESLARTRSSDVLLTVIGDGPRLGSLRKLAERLDLDQRVTFAGPLARRAMVERFWEADGLVSMSAADGLPREAMLAMSCHCPAVLSDCAAHRELCGDTDVMVPLIAPQDQQGLTDLLDAWRAMPGDVRRSWGIDCREHVERHFSQRRAEAAWDRLLDEYDPAQDPSWAMFCRCVRRLPTRRRG